MCQVDCHCQCILLTPHQKVSDDVEDSMLNDMRPLIAFEATEVRAGGPVEGLRNEELLQHSIGVPA